MKENFVNLQMGKNELRERDLINLSIHYGAIDRWLMQPGNDDQEPLKVINSNNRKNIPIGEKVKLSDSAFSTWIKLISLTDRSENRKYNYHAKGKISYLTKKMGYKDRSGFYKVLKILYDVGLLDVKESNFNGDIYTDILVYPYPIYADSDICDLIRIREWEKRESQGMVLSRKGVKARKQPVDKSPQEPVDKSPQEPVDKSPQEPVDKSPQEPVDKSPHTNIYNNTNDLITNIYNHHLMKEFTRDEQIELGRFLGIHRIDDDDTITEFLQRIIDFPPKTNSKVKYFKTVLDSIINNRKPLNKKRTEKLPDWYEDYKKRYKPSEEVLTFESTEEFLKAKRELEERLKKYK